MDLPKIFILMKGRSEADYKQNFSAIKDLAVKAGAIFNPPDISLDFEIATIKSLKSGWFATLGKIFAQSIFYPPSSYNLDAHHIPPGSSIPSFSITTKNIFGQNGRKFQFKIAKNLVTS